MKEVKSWVDEEYAGGRVTVLTDDELEDRVDAAKKKLGILIKEGE